MYKIDKLLKHPQLKEKENAMLRRIREEFIEEGCDKFLYRKHKEKEADMLQTQEFIKRQGALKPNSHIINFIKQFDDIDLEKEIPFIFPQSYSPNYFMAREISKNAKKFNVVNNIYEEEDQNNWLAVFDRNDEKSIGMMFRVIYSSVFSETYGGYKLFGKGLTAYSEYLEFEGIVLEPKWPNLLAHYLGNPFTSTDPERILECRKVVKMLIRQGYFIDELEIFRNFYDILLPFMHEWYRQASKVLKETVIDTKNLANVLRSQLVADGVIATKWKSERMLFGEIKELYNDAVFQYRPSWLEPQSLDIFIPALNLGIEYQGIQHYESVDFFGGDEALRHRQQLDEKKRKLCESNNVRLLEWSYTDEISKRRIKARLEQFQRE